MLSVAASTLAPVAARLPIGRLTGRDRPAAGVAAAALGPAGVATERRIPGPPSTCGCRPTGARPAGRDSRRGPSAGQARSASPLIEYLEPARVRPPSVPARRRPPPTGGSRARPRPVGRGRPAAGHASVIGAARRILGDQSTLVIDQMLVADTDAARPPDRPPPAAIPVRPARLPGQASPGWATLSRRDRRPRRQARRRPGDLGRRRDDRYPRHPAPERRRHHVILRRAQPARPARPDRGRPHPGRRHATAS